MDELREILDRVDVVMRRRRDERHARRRVPRSRDHLVHLVARKLAALSRLRTLRDLDLELAGAHEILRRHAEAGRSDLLDGTVPLRAKALAFLAAFTGVAPAADAVHCDRERLMCLTTE